MPARQYWCHDCKRDHEVDEDDGILRCNECGGIILCDHCGQPWEPAHETAAVHPWLGSFNADPEPV